MKKAVETISNKFAHAVNAIGTAVPIVASTAAFMVTRDPQISALAFMATAYDMPQAVTVAATAGKPSLKA